MIQFSEILVKLGPMLLIGTTVLFAIGCLTVWLTSSPVHRQRLGETTVAAVLVWMVLAVLPFPRLLPQSLWTNEANIEGTIQRTTDETYGRFETGRDVASIDPIASSSDPVSQFDSSPLQGNDDESHSTAQLIDPHNDDRMTFVPTASPSGSFSSISRNQIGTIAAGLYLVAAIACFAWLIVGHMLLIAERLRGRTPEPWLRELFESLKTPADPTHTKLLISAACRRPISWGTIRPVIVLPAALCRPQNEDRLRIILLHELGHVAQGDAWGNLLLTTAFPVLCVQPLYWWLRSQVRLAAELVADERAAQQIGKDVYASQLIALARAARSGWTFWGVTGVVSSHSLFYRRMQMLITRETPLVHRSTTSWRLLSLTVAGLTVAVAAALLGTHAAEGQQAPLNHPTLAQDHGPVASEENSATKNAPLSDAASLGLPLAPSIPIAPSDQVAPSDPLSNQPQQELPLPPAKLPKPEPPALPPVKVIRPGPQVDVPGGEQATHAKDSKDDLVIIRSADGGQVEVFMESDGGKTRMTAKRFIMQGNRILSADAGSIETIRKPGANQGKPSSTDRTSNGDPKWSAVEDDGVHRYRVLVKDRDGDLVLEKWTSVDGEKPQLVGRFPLPPEIVRQVNRQSETTTREDKLLEDEEKLQNLMKTYGPKHPQVLEIQDRIKQTQKWLDQRSLPHPPKVAKQAGPLTETTKRERSDSDKPRDARETASKPSLRSTAEPAVSNRIDLLSLATTYADALSAVESSSDPVVRQQADRKAKLIRRMIDVERRSVAEEWGRMAKLYEAGAVSSHDIAELKSRRAMLDEILKLDQGTAEDPAAAKSPISGN